MKKKFKSNINILHAAAIQDHYIKNMGLDIKQNFNLNVHRRSNNATNNNNNNNNSNILRENQLNNLQTSAMNVLNNLHSNV